MTVKPFLHPFLILQIASKSGSPGRSNLADVITANDVEKTVRIVITSGMVNHDKFLSGLRDSLVPACKKVRFDPEG